MEPLTAGDPRQVGGFQLHARLGAGGMGQVFLGFSPAGRAVAVKVIHREFARDPEFVRRFGREVRAAEAVSGAYTAPVVAAGPGDDPPWLATVFVPGPSLAEVITGAGPLPQAAVWRLAGGLIEALQAVHARGLVHRDLKPANVLLASDGPRLIDFGISRALEGTAMTGTSMIVGTPAFMSPEQAEGLRVGPASDVFALGSVIAFAATGAAPFGASTSGPVAMAYRVVHAHPDLSRVPVSLRDLVAGCLAKNPADRPQLPRLMDAVRDGAAPYPASWPGDFWPEPVAGMISSRQDSVRAQLPAGDGPGAGRSMPSWPHEPTTPAKLSPGYGGTGTTRSHHSGHRDAPAGPGFTQPGQAAPGLAGQPGHHRPAGRRRALMAGAAAAALIGAAGIAYAISAAAPGPEKSPSPVPGRSTSARAARAVVHHQAHTPASPAARPATAVMVCTFPASTCTGPGGGAEMKAHPARLITAADGSGYMKGITWSGWGNATATGTGTLEIDNCVPDCATGTFTGYPATVTLTGLSSFGSGAAAYSRMMLTAPTAPYPAYTYTSGLVP